MSKDKNVKMFPSVYRSNFTKNQTIKAQFRKQTFSKLLAYFLDMKSNGCDNILRLNT